MSFSQPGGTGRLLTLVLAVAVVVSGFVMTPPSVAQEGWPGTQITVTADPPVVGPGTPTQWTTVRAVTDAPVSGPYTFLLVSADHTIESWWGLYPEQPWNTLCAHDGEGGEFCG